MLTNATPRWLLVVFTTLAACALPAEPVETSDDALARPGAWSIPSSTRRIADAQHVAYDGAGAWIGSAGCGGGLLSGTAEVRHYLLANFPQVSGVGGYACRANTADTSRMSVHGTGRALDVFIPLSAGDADNDAGDAVANWLIEHTEEIGIQYVIWDRWQWNSSRTAGDKDRSYGGPHPHHDHIHVELTEEAAARRTAWFTSPMAPPATAPAIPRTCDAGTSYTPRFCDDDGHWAESSIQYLHDHGLTAGCGEINGKPRFCPEDPSTRAQVLTILARASSMPLAGHPDAFDDDDGHFAERALNAAAAFGITRGCGTRRICPNDPATRSHVAVFIARTYGLPAATRDYFDDDEGSPFEAAHDRLAAAGITAGCGTRRFCGGEISTRAMLAVFVTRLHSRGFPPVWSADEPEPAGAEVVPPDEPEDPPAPEEPADPPAPEEPADPPAPEEPADPPAPEDPIGPSEAVIDPSEPMIEPPSIDPVETTPPSTLVGACNAAPGSAPGTAWLLALAFIAIAGRRR